MEREGGAILWDSPAFGCLLIMCFIFLTPVPHGIKNRFQAVTQISERIFYMRRNLWVYSAYYQAAFSIWRSCAVRTFCVICPIEFFNSPNLFVPGSKSLRISTFHLSLMSIRVVSTGQEGSSFAGVFKDFFCSFHDVFLLLVYSILQVTMAQLSAYFTVRWYGFIIVTVNNKCKIKNI